MRILVLAAAFFISFPAMAQVASPQPNSQVKITTPMLSYEGIFLREETFGRNRLLDRPDR